MTVKSPAESKASVNLRISSSLKNKAKAHGLNLSRILEKTLQQEISQQEQQAWLAENRRAIQAYNKRTETRGPALAAYRSF